MRWRCGGRAGLRAIWSAEMPRSPGYAFYDKLQKLLIKAGFDAFVEGVCKPHYAPRMGAPSLPPGRYFRMHLVGYFEGIDSERGIVWRCSDSFSLRGFLRLANRDKVPDHSWLSKTRSRLPHEAHGCAGARIVRRRSLSRRHCGCRSGRRGGQRFRCPQPSTRSPPRSGSRHSGRKRFVVGFSQGVAVSFSHAAMSAMGRNRTEESEPEGVNPQLCQKASASASIARTTTARPPIASAPVTQRSSA